MPESLAGFNVRDGDLVSARDLPAAVTAGLLRYTDGSRQSPHASGLSTYFEGARPTEGQWSVDDDGCFTSFWPSFYRVTD